MKYFHCPGSSSPYQQVLELMRGENTGTSLQQATNETGEDSAAHLKVMENTKTDTVD
jgi:hypothetical protein